MSYTITEVTAPSYAPDGSRGYAITIVRDWTDRNGATGQHVLHGWIDRASGEQPSTCRVLATIDHYPWEFVTKSPVSDTEWSAQWVFDHASDIVSIYGWKG